MKSLCTFLFILFFNSLLQASPPVMAWVRCELDEKSADFAITVGNEKKDTYFVDHLVFKEGDRATSAEAKVTEIILTSPEAYLPFTQLNATMKDGHFVFYSNTASNYFLSVWRKSFSLMETYVCDVSRTKPGVIISN